MWLCLKTGFYSAVQDDNDPDYLWTRARHGDHLKSLFPCDIKTQETIDRDYRYRCRVTRDDLAKIVSDRVRHIDYGNFKSSVQDRRLRTLYSRFWLLHLRYQEAGAK